MRRVPPEMFRFTTGERAGLYGAGPDAFGVAGEHLETALGLDAVRRRLRGTGWAAAVRDEELHDVLASLRRDARGAGPVVHALIGPGGGGGRNTTCRSRRSTAGRPDGVGV